MSRLFEVKLSIATVLTLITIIVTLGGGFFWYDQLQDSKHRQNRIEQAEINRTQDTFINKHDVYIETQSKKMVKLEDALDRLQKEVQSNGETGKLNGQKMDILIESLKERK